MATSGAEVAGPGFAGALIKLVGAPFALLLDALLLLASATILRGVRAREDVRTMKDANFWRDLRTGLRFVTGTPLLVALAVVVGVFQMCHHAAIVVQILVATRTLGLTEQQVGLSYMGMGLGTITSSMLGNRISRRVGPGPCLLIGFAVCGCGWLLLALAPANGWGVAAFALTLLMFSAGAVLVFINFLALRQAVTPQPLLGRMTSAMRWLTLLPAGPGALLGGWLGEHVGLRAALVFSGVTALLLALIASRHPAIWGVKALPQPDEEREWVGVEASVRPTTVLDGV